MTHRLSCLYPFHCQNQAVNHAFYSICSAWQRPELQATLIVPSCEPSLRSANVIEAVPRWIKPLVYRWEAGPRHFAQQTFLRSLNTYDAAFIWPGVSLSVLQKTKAAHKPIFLERINTHVGYAKSILDQESQRLGVSPQHEITATDITHESSELKLADYIFVASPEMRKSFLEAGVEAEKLIDTSYGWEPKRFPKLGITEHRSEQINVLFLARICVRKGAHRLLQWWEKANLKAQLTLFGAIDPAIEQTCRHLFALPTVQHVGFTLNYTDAYRHADFFVMPSFEEGSPLVVYEAMAHGLPILASPMGSGGIVRDGIDGFVIAPQQDDDWIEALTTLCHSAELRKKLGQSARERAQCYTWEKVAHRRALEISARLSV